MFALGIADRLEGDTLFAGLNVAGTGTIAANGDVGVVGGTPLKLRAAQAAGARLFLLPAAECSEVHSDPAMPLVPVHTLRDALGAVTAAGHQQPLPRC